MRCRRALRFQSVLRLRRGERGMAHAAKAHWISSLIMMAVTASCITWIIISKKETKPIISIINGTSVAEILENLSSKVSSTFRVEKSFADGKHLAWEKVGDNKNFSLDESKTWITVEEQGVYLAYVHVTYSLKKDGDASSTDLDWIMQVNFPEATDDSIGAFDTRQLTDKEQDAQLSAFFLLQLKAGNRLSIVSNQKRRIINDTTPFSSYITLVRIADWSA